MSMIFGPSSLAIMFIDSPPCQSSAATSLASSARISGSATLFQRGAPADALAQTQAGVMRDELPALRYRLDHGERPVSL
jgi:hypothetical protein